ncbi:MAG: hypothetical protein S4CHLAM123_06070 [Chlamydiales bacterium]|nr:hypothetical protein [Chlamydiales bacterium]
MIRTFNEFNPNYNHYENGNKKQKTEEDNQFFNLNTFSLENVFYYLVESSDTSIGKSLHHCELTSKCFYEISQRVKRVYFDSLKIPLGILGQKKAAEFIQQYAFSDLGRLGLTALQKSSDLELMVKGDLKINLGYFLGLTSLNYSPSTLVSVDFPPGFTQLKHLELSNVKGNFPSLQNCKMLNTLKISGGQLKDAAGNFASTPFTNLVELSIRGVGFEMNIENMDFPNLKRFTFYNKGSTLVKPIALIDLSRCPNIESVDLRADMDERFNLDQMIEIFHSREIWNIFEFDITCFSDANPRIFVHYQGAVTRI